MDKETKSCQWIRNWNSQANHEDSEGTPVWKSGSLLQALQARGVFADSGDRCPLVGVWLAVFFLALPQAKSSAIVDGMSPKGVWLTLVCHGFSAFALPMPHARCCFTLALVKASGEAMVPGIFAWCFSIFFADLHRASFCFSLA